MGEDDIPLVCAWRNRPHMRRFYQKSPLSLEEARLKLTPRVRGEDATLAHIACLGERPFGYVQSYLILDTPAYAEEIGVSDGVGMDYFIGEPELIGRGLGKAMLVAYLREVLFPAFPEERRCVVCYELANAASRGVLEAVGFSFERELIEGGVPSGMMVLQRPA